MGSRRRASRAVAPLALAAGLALWAGCGGDGQDADDGAPASTAGLREALSSGSCPPENLVLRSGQRYSRAAVGRARERALFRVHEATRRLELPVDWLQDPYASKAFRGRLADLDWTEVLFYAYRENGDLGALRQARDLVLDWVESQPRGGERTSDQAWEGKAVGDRVLHLAYLGRAGGCEGILTQAQLDLLAASIAEHAAVLTDPEVYRPTNHGLFMDLALVLLSEQLHTAQSPQWRELAIERYEDTFRSGVVEDEGFWLEHSAGYQILLTKLLAKSLATPGFESPALVALLERMRDVTGWLVMPDGGIPQFGHSDATRAPGFARSRARDDRGLLALLGTGLAVVKEPGSYLSVVAMFHSTAHKQADELSFDLYERGLRVVSDTGLYHKDRDRFYAFAQSPAAHSTLSVDGEGFPFTEDRAYGSGLLAAGEGEGWYAILGRNPLLEPAGVEHTRLFLYKPGEALIVADRVRSSERHTYRRYFQLGPDVRLFASETIVEGRLHGSAREDAIPDELLLRSPTLDGSLTSFSSAGLEGLRMARGEAHPLAGFTFPGFREKLPRWTVTYVSQAADADYATAFGIDEPGLRVVSLRLHPRSATMELRSPGHEASLVEVARTGSRLDVSEAGGGP